MRAIDIEACFSADFFTARQRFLDAAAQAGAGLRTFRHDLSGPGGEPLATDVAVIGDVGAPRALVLVAGTHGVEGLPGSALLLAQLRAGALVPRSGLAIVLVHALNPYGMASLRRVNEDNVDLNRNFAPFPEPPANEAYARLHPVLTMAPHRLGRARREAMLAAHLAAKGKRALQQAVTQGQFTHPQGLFFGGKAPSWSRRTWDAILAMLRDKARVLIIDYHTGLGPRGVGELICPDSPPATSAPRSWRAGAMAACFGRHGVRYLATGDSVSSPIHGDMLSYSVSERDGIAAVALEFGTLPAIRVLSALIDENWAHHAADPDLPRHRDRLLAAFAPADPLWRQSIWRRTQAVTHDAIRGLLD